MRSIRFLLVMIVLAGFVAIAVASSPVAAGQQVPPKPPQPPKRPASAQGGVTFSLPRIQSGGNLGVSVKDLSPTGKDNGVEVTDVSSGSPAQKAGIKAGDLIIEFDGEKVRSVAQFQRLVRETPAGRTVKLAVMRDGKRTDLTAALREDPTVLAFDDHNAIVAPHMSEEQRRALQEQMQSLRDQLRKMKPFDEEKFRQDMQALRDQLRMRPFDDQRFRDEMDQMRRQLRDNLQGYFNYRAEPRTPRTPSAPAPDVWSRFSSRLVRGGRLGVTAQALTDQLGAFFGAKEGALITEVTDGSPAAKAGLKAGDVITSIDGKSVRNPSDLPELVGSGAADRSVAVGIIRDKRPTTVTVKLEGTPRRAK